MLVSPLKREKEQKKRKKEKGKSLYYITLRKPKYRRIIWYTRSRHENYSWGFDLKSHHYTRNICKNSCAFSNSTDLEACPASLLLWSQETILLLSRSILVFSHVGFLALHRSIRFTLLQVRVGSVAQFRWGNAPVGGRGRRIDVNGWRSGSALGLIDFNSLWFATVTLAIIGRGVATAGETPGGASNTLANFPLTAFCDDVKDCWGDCR